MVYRSTARNGTSIDPISKHLSLPFGPCQAAGSDCNGSPMQKPPRIAKSTRQHERLRSVEARVRQRNVRSLRVRGSIICNSPSFHWFARSR